MEPTITFYVLSTNGNGRKINLGKITVGKSFLLPVKMLVTHVNERKKS
jgi:hypothetical protein